MPLPLNGAERRSGQSARSAISWRMFSKQLSYQEIELHHLCFSLHGLLLEHQSYPNIFHETRRLTLRTVWSNDTQELSSLIQSMPRLEWLELSTHEIEKSHFCTRLVSILGAQSCLLYLDLEPYWCTECPFIDSETISLISRSAIRLQRLTCAIKYVTRSNGQVCHGPRFQSLQVLQMMDICCDPGHEQATCEWFSQWNVPPSLKQFRIPETWKYCIELLSRGVGAQLEVLDASVRIPGGMFSRTDMITDAWCYS